MGFRAYQNITSREVCVLIHSQDKGREKREENLSPFYKHVHGSDCVETSSDEDIIPPSSRNKTEAY